MNHYMRLLVLAAIAIGVAVSSLLSWGIIMHQRVQERMKQEAPLSAFGSGSRSGMDLQVWDKDAPEEGVTYRCRYGAEAKALIDPKDWKPTDCVFLPEKP